MFIEGEDSAIVAAKDFIDTIAKIYTSIQISRVDFLYWKDIIIDHRKFHLRCSPK